MTNNLILKSQLSPQQMILVQSEVDKKAKSKTIALLFWWFLGAFGGHRFYTGDTGRALCMMFFGIFTLYIWNLVDGFLIGKRVEEINEQIELEEIMRVKAMTGGMQ